jgi:hypothetical protein
MGSGTTEVSSLMFLLDPHDSLLQVGSAYLQSGVRHILLTKADSCSRCMFISQKNSFYLNLISLIHRAGFILSLAHLGIFISLRSAIFTLHFSFFAGMSVVFVGDGESKDNLHLFDQERYISALFTDDS